MASGSGPLSSLLFFKVLLVLLALKFVGNKVLVNCSNWSLLSQTNWPVVPFHIEKDLAPKQKILSNKPSLLKSPYLLETFNLPIAVFAFNAATAAAPPNLLVSNV